MAVDVDLSSDEVITPGPFVSFRQVVGILSQGSSASAYVMGISTAKTIMRAKASGLEKIYTPRPLVERWRLGQGKSNGNPSSACSVAAAATGGASTAM